MRQVRYLGSEVRPPASSLNSTPSQYVAFNQSLGFSVPPWAGAVRKGWKYLPKQQPLPPVLLFLLASAGQFSWLWTKKKSMPKLIILPIIAKTACEAEGLQPPWARGLDPVGRSPKLARYSTPNYFLQQSCAPFGRTATNRRLEESYGNTCQRAPLPATPHGSAVK